MRCLALLAFVLLAPARSRTTVAWSGYIEGEYR